MSKDNMPIKVTVSMAVPMPDGKGAKVVDVDYYMTQGQWVINPVIHLAHLEARIATVMRIARQEYDAAHGLEFPKPRPCPICKDERPGPTDLVATMGCSGCGKPMAVGPRGNF